MNNGTKYISGALLCTTKRRKVRSRLEVKRRHSLVVATEPRVPCVCVTIAQPCAVSAIRLFKPGKQFRALSRNNIARRYSRSSFVARTRKTRYLVLTAPAALTIGWHYVTFNHPRAREYNRSWVRELLREQCNYEKHYIVRFRISP